MEPAAEYTHFSVETTVLIPDSQVDTALIFTITGSDIGESTCVMVDELQLGDVSPVFEAGQNNLDIGIYPNPASDKVRFTTDLTGSIEVQLFDATGRVLDKLRQMDIGDELNISHLSPGIYHLLIRQGEQYRMVKLKKN